MEEYITTNMYANHDSSSYGLSGYQGATPAVNFVSPSTYYGDPTRVFDSSEGEELVGEYFHADFYKSLNEAYTKNIAEYYNNNESLL